jgi:hypothetical protein
MDKLKIDELRVVFGGVVIRYPSKTLMTLRKRASKVYSGFVTKPSKPCTSPKKPSADDDDDDFVF